MNLIKNDMNPDNFLKAYWIRSRVIRDTDASFVDIDPYSYSLYLTSVTNRYIGIVIICKI